MGRGAVSVLLLVFQFDIVLAKTRSWIGPTQLVQGNPPIPRDSFGITSSGENVYIYGGIGEIIGNR